jgi:hypothetical protein
MAYDAWTDRELPNLEGQIQQTAGKAPPGLLEMADRPQIPDWVTDVWNNTPQDQRSQLAVQYDPANWMRPNPIQGLAPVVPAGAREVWNNTPEDRRPSLAEQYKPANYSRVGNSGQGNLPLGRMISEAKRYYDLHRPVTDPMTAGSFRPAPSFGQGMYWSTTGELGIPGQIDQPYGTMWGAGGP